MNERQQSLLEFELPEQVDALIEKVREYLPSADTSRIVSAYLFALRSAITDSIGGTDSRTSPTRWRWRTSSPTSRWG